MMKKNSKRAFALMYALMGVGITFILVSAGFGTALTSLKTSRNKEESLKTFYAADTGVECVRFYQNHLRAFDTTTPEATYNCGVGADFRAGSNPPTAQCEPKVCDLRVYSSGKNSCSASGARLVERVRWENF